jgi:SAM-dependent methyltransferase
VSMPKTVETGSFEGDTVNNFLRGVLQATIATFSLPDPIVEVGSLQREGREELVNLRPFFPDRPYVGIDMQPGPGVDRVENVESLTLDSSSAGTVIAMNTFEHVRRLWLAIAEVKRILRPDGVLFVSTPFYFHIHAYPSDYWRLTPEAWDSLLEREFPQRILGQCGPRTRPLHVWAVAFGHDYPPISDEQVADYEAAISRYAKSPPETLRTLRYLSVQWLVGRRPMAPHLDRDLFELQLRRGTSEAKAA